MILTSKFLSHQPLNRQSETYAREGVEIDVSTLAGWVRCENTSNHDPIAQLTQRIDSVPPAVVPAFQTWTHTAD